MTVAFALVTSLTVSACTPMPPRPPDPVPPPTERVLAGALRGGAGAVLLVGDAASRVEVRLAEMPGLLYRVSTPSDSGLTPSVRIYRVSTPSDSGLTPSVRISRDVVRLSLEPTGGAGPDTVRIVLNRRIRWDVRLPAGAGEQQLDLSAGRVTRVELGASGLVELNLPHPWGTIPVLLRRGAGTVELTTPPATPVRLSLPEGAGAVTTPWTVNNGTPAATTLTAPGWHRATDRYTIRLTSGAGSIAVREREP